jgi:sRNA-binding carbon storage regulator CsrA
MGKLVLSRKPGESIEIYDPTNEAMGVIILTQRNVRGNKSSIEIEAPKHLIIKRAELAGKGGAK